MFAKDERELDSLVNTVCVFSKDIDIEFGLKKGVVLVLKHEKVVEFKGIELLNGSLMKTIQDDGYKYLGVLEVKN